jgi:hypothetical protein
LLVVSSWIFFVRVALVVEEEFARRLQVGPAVGVEDGTVHRGVQLAELEDVGRALVGVVKAVVGLRQTLVVADHQGSAEVVVGPAPFFQLGIVLEACREGKGLKAPLWHVGETFFMGGSIK